MLDFWGVTLKSLQLVLAIYFSNSPILEKLCINYNFYHHLFRSKASNKTNQNPPKPSPPPKKKKTSPQKVVCSFRKNPLLKKNIHPNLYTVYHVKPNETRGLANHQPRQRKRRPGLPQVDQTLCTDPTDGNPCVHAGILALEADTTTRRGTDPEGRHGSTRENTVFCTVV